MLKLLMERNNITGEMSCEEMLKVVQGYAEGLGTGDGKLKVVAFLIEGKLRSEMAHAEGLEKSEK